ncbi:MAG: FGGY-family carbohydrate kinase [Aigarchaeota archaeon]|nr:FGGY-family carbohydrate kinase [Aigarchaeota archaeon]
MEAPLFLGTDIGTFGTKTCLVDASGNVLATSFIESDIMIPQPGWAEQWPDVWWNVYVQSVREVLEISKVDPADIAGISISGLFSGAGVPVDKEFKPIRPVIIWMDRRAVDETEWVKREIGVDAIFEKTGNVVDPYYGFPKILWIKRNEPKNWEKIHKLMTIYGYVIYKLTGVNCIDHSSAGNIGGIYDIHKRDWCEELMEELGIPREFFPEEINCSKDVVGEISEEGARATGLKKGTTVVAGGIDAPMSALSVTALEDGDLTSMIGTSMCNGVIQDELRLSKKIVTLPHVAYDTKKVYSHSGIATAGAVVRWFRDMLSPFEKLAAENSGISAYMLLDRMAEKINPGADGLVFTPHMMVGERAPFWSKNMRSCLFGLTISHTKAHIYRAFLESVAYALRDSIEVAKEAGIPIKRIILVDGGAKSPIWRQIMADVTGYELRYVEAAVGAPLGDALIAGVGTGYLKYETINEWVSVDRVVNPNPKNTGIYEKYYQLYKKIHQSLEECYELASQLIESTK